MSEAFFTSQDKQLLRRRLNTWYAKHARELPWRQNSDSYRVWVSEVMLQQTQVETVRSYFERFTDRFPTVSDLAKADEEEVLKLWEGLGYYRRARSLHAAAKQVVEVHDGVMPDSVEELMKLPGIGRYTAGAIVSIALDKRAPILEANTIRVFTRLTAYEGEPTKAAGQRFLWGVAEEVLPHKNIAPFNQALMELGSLVCTPTQPACDKCPVNKVCVGYNEGKIDSLGPTTTKLKFADANEVAVVVSDRLGRYLLRRCQPDERWSGLWDFPRFARDAESPVAIEQECKTKVESLTGVKSRVSSHLKQIKHAVTRFRITLDCYLAKRTGGRLRGDRDSLRWVSSEELAELPLSVTGRKIAKMLSKLSD